MKNISIKGGSWYTNIAYLHVTHRSFNNSTNEDDRLGFRIIKYN
jgi:formylglycine-generating enzyme required for sulfatase activity